MRQPRHTTSQRTARHRKAAHTLFFNLSHEAFAETTYFLVGGGAWGHAFKSGATVDDESFRCPRPKKRRSCRSSTAGRS